MQARPASLRYRMRKYLERHRLGVAAGFVVVSALAAGLGLALWQADRAGRERDVARREAAKAARVSAFMAELFQLANPTHSRGATITVREVLDSGRIWIDRELTEQPELRGEMLLHVGEAYFGLGFYEQAQRLWEDRLALLQDRHGDQHPDVATTMTKLAMVLDHVGEFRDSEAMARRALAVWEMLPESDAVAIATLLDLIAYSLFLQGRSAEAEVLVRRALDLVPLSDSENPHSRTVYLTTLAHVLREQGDPAGAEALHREILDVRRAWWGTDHPEVANTLVNIAGVLADQRRFAAAESLFHEGLAMRRATQGEGHPDIGIDVAGLADLLRQKGDTAAAIAIYREAVAIQRETLPAGHPILVKTLRSLGELLLDKGHAAEADSLLRELEQAGRPARRISSR